MKNLKDFFKGKKILITGHTGFKGAWLAYILHMWGADVAGIAFLPHTTPNLFSILELGKKIRSYYADIRDYVKVRDIFDKEKPEIVFHLAAQPIVRKSYDDPLETYTTNIIGTANILEAIRESEGVKSAVIVTTDKVYKNKNDTNGFKEEDPLGGHDPYSASKAAADIIAQSYLRSFDLPIAIARAGNVIGGGDWGEDRIMTDLVRSIYESRGIFFVRDPKAVRPWQYVLEPLSGYLLLAKSIYGHPTCLADRRASIGAWNFGPTGEDFFSVEDLLKEAASHVGSLDWRIVPDVSKPEAKLLRLDSKKSTDKLGWIPKVGFKETVAKTLSWYKNYYSGGDIHELTNHQINQYFAL